MRSSLQEMGVERWGRGGDKTWTKESGLAEDVGRSTQPPLATEADDTRVALTSNSMIVNDQEVMTTLA